MKARLELIPHELNSSIYAFIYDNHCFESPWHYHDELELTYIKKGNGIRYVGNSIHNYQAGDLVLLGTTLPHAWKNSEGYSEGVSSLCIQWKPKVLEPLLDNLIEFRAINKLIKAAQQGLHFPQTAETDQIVRQMDLLLQQDGTEKILTFLNILNLLTKHKSSDPLCGLGDDFIWNETNDHRVVDILKYVETNFNKHICIANMAEITFMTNVSFCKYFKKQFNKSFTNYLNEYRIRKACQILQESDHPLIHIALQCGYENMSFFHRQFKKYLTKTPNEYRSSYN